MASFLSRRLAAIAATGAAVIALVVAPLSGADAAGSKTLTLLNINDFHGRISTDIAMGLANTIQTERSANPTGSLLLSAGDNVGASLYVSSVQKDKPTLEYLNALGLKASAVGNHEFDAGAKDLMDRIIPEASFSYLGANVLNPDGSPALQPYYITDVNGTSVAVIGAVTTETPQLTNPSELASLQFTDPVAAVNKYAAQLSDGDTTNGEAQVIIAEYHEGVNTADPASDAIVNQTSSDVDVIFTGHTHQEYVIDGPVPGKPGKTRPIIQTGNYGANLGKVELTLNDSGEVTAYTSELVKRMETPTAEQVATDPVLAKVNSIVSDANAYATAQGSVIAGQISAPITTGFDSGKDTQGGFDMRNYESTMGHLVADMYLAAANSTGRTHADIGIVNPGGLRDELPGGLRSSLAAATNQQVRVMDIVNVTPFANNLWTTDLTGAQLKAVLEEQWQQNASGQMANRPYLQLGFSSNLTYTYTGSTDAAGYATRGSHILEVYVNGKKVNDTDTFTVAIPSFLLGGGDNFGTFTQGTNPKDTALVDSDAFVNYFKTAGTVSPNYAKQAVQVKDLATSYDVNGRLAFTLADLNVRSFGVPHLNELKVSVDGTEVGTVAVAEDGTANVALDLAGKGITAGKHGVLLTDASGATGTSIRLSAEFTGQSTNQPAPGETQEPAPITKPTAHPTNQPAPGETQEPAPITKPTAHPTKEPAFAPNIQPSNGAGGVASSPTTSNRLANTGFTAGVIALIGGLVLLAGIGIFRASHRKA